MPKYISKVVTYTDADGNVKTREAIDHHGLMKPLFGTFLVDDEGHIIHDKCREEDMEGVDRRIEVEGFKAGIRMGAVLREKNPDGSLKKDKKGNIIYGVSSLANPGEGHERPRFFERFPGTMDQAEKEMEKEIKLRADIEAKFRKEMANANLKVVKT
jgi:hypothetical protein